MGTDHWMQAVIELLHQHKCKSHAPPKRFYESQPPDSLVTTTQIAKEYGCGAKVFNRLLHLHGIQYRTNNQWVLYAKHQDKGYTANLVFRLHRSDGSAVEKLHTAYLWTIQIQVITMKWLSRPYCTWCGCTVITMPPH